jgi:hypothetical protein
MKYKITNDVISVTTEGASVEALHQLKTKGLLAKINEEILKPAGLVAVVTYPSQDFQINKPTSIHIEEWKADE